jgi:hypothetical protein
MIPCALRIPTTWTLIQNWCISRNNCRTSFTIQEAEGQPRVVINVSDPDDVLRPVEALAKPRWRVNPVRFRDLQTYATRCDPAFLDLS